MSNTMNISIPPGMRDYIEQQAAEGAYTTSEYIRHLIRTDIENKEQEKRLRLAQYLARAEQQISDGKVSKPNFNDIVALSKKLAKKKAAPTKKKR